MASERQTKRIRIAAYVLVVLVCWFVATILFGVAICVPEGGVC